MSNLKCKRPECIKKYNAILEQMGGWDDTEDDFNPFHCCVKDCHDISLGKTSYPCGGVGCTNYICQNCGDDKKLILWDEEESDSPLCPQCQEEVNSFE